MRLEAQRGAIYDATGTPLAWSATVYNVYIDPQLFREEMDDVQKNNESKQAAAEKTAKLLPTLWMLQRSVKILPPIWQES